MNKKFYLKRSDTNTAFIMLAPILVLLTCFVVIPLIYAIIVSFYEWNFYQDSVFIAFENYKRVLKDTLFYKSLLTGVKFSLLVIPTQFILAFLFANLIKSIGGRLGGFIKTSIYIPYVVSGVVASLIFMFIYNYNGGLANFILVKLGFERIAWTADIKIVL